MFATTYAQARTLFLNAARAAGATLHSDAHPLKGCEGEDLALDIAVLGEAAAPKRVLLSSGVHGVEGYCGSGIQWRCCKTQRCWQAPRPLASP